MKAQIIRTKQEIDAMAARQRQSVEKNSEGAQHIVYELKEAEAKKFLAGEISEQQARMCRSWSGLNTSQAAQYIVATADYYYKLIECIDLQRDQFLYTLETTVWSTPNEIDQFLKDILAQWQKPTPEDIDAWLDAFEV